MEILVLVLVNLGLAWSCIASFAVASLLFEKGTHGPDNGAAFYALTACLLPVLLTWWLAFGLTVSRGIFDGWGLSRQWQYGWMLASCLGVVLLLMGVALDRMLPLASMLILPVMTALAAMLVYRVGPLAWAQRGALAMSLLGLLVTGAGTGYVVWQTTLRGAVRTLMATGKPDSFVLGMVRDIDPEKNFGSLLNHTSRHSHRVVRKLALDKVHGVPDWEQRVQESLRNGHHMAALVFLRDNAVPDPLLFTEGIREAIRLAVEEAREERLYPASWEKGKAEEVVKKWAGYGVDLSKEMAELERAVARMKRRD
ncbi:MAG: hypothetical protein JNK87_10970 [Bryobacterales bacterium]|nr:hypothetical protein [Bryobacterales bacterium]